MILATRGSALALAQANLVLARCRAAFPQARFEIKIFKTTGDKLQSVPAEVPAMAGTKGLFTKELEVALLSGEADLAVHSLKDLPTDLPDGLELSATLPRADVRDVLIYRRAEAQIPIVPQSGSQMDPLLSKSGVELKHLRPGAVVATSSTRRAAQVQAIRPDLKVVPIRGNVGTRLQKLADQSNLDALILAAAGLHRLHIGIATDGSLFSEDLEGKKPLPEGLRATFLPVAEMLPCVGQGAIGIEGRTGDARMGPILAQLNDEPTLACVTAERAFLRAMGGGCLSPVAAHAEVVATEIRLRVVSFREQSVRRSERQGPKDQAGALGILAAEDVKG